MKKIILFLVLVHINLYGSIELMKNEYLVLKIDEEQYIKKKLQSEASLLKFYLDKKEIVFDNLYIKKETIFFELLDSDDVLKLKALLSKEFSSLRVNNKNQIYELKLTSLKINELVDKSVASLQKSFKDNGIYPKDSIYARFLTFIGLMDELRVDVKKLDGDKILVESRNINTQKDIDIVRTILISKSFGLYEVVEQKEKLNITQMYMSDITQKDKKYLLQKVPILTTSMIRKASVGFTGSDNRPSLILTFTPLGKKILADYTSTHISKKMAVVIDEEVYVAPLIVDGIFKGKLQITGDFDAKELHDLSTSLNADFLVPMGVVESKSFVEE